MEGDQKSPSLHSLYGNELMKNVIININFMEMIFSFG
jgi:hypothetical protein